MLVRVLSADRGPLSEGRGHKSTLLGSPLCWIIFNLSLTLSQSSGRLPCMECISEHLISGLQLALANGGHQEEPRGWEKRGGVPHCYWGLAACLELKAAAPTGLPPTRTGTLSTFC